MVDGLSMKYLSAFLSLTVGLVIFFRADSIVSRFVDKYHLSSLNQTDLRFRHAKIVFKILGAVSITTGIWGLARTLIHF